MDKQLKSLVKDLELSAAEVDDKMAADALRLAVSYLKEIPKLVEALEEIKTNHCHLMHYPKDACWGDCDCTEKHAERALAEYKGELPPETNE